VPSERAHVPYGPRLPPPVIHMLRPRRQLLGTGLLALTALIAPVFAIVLWFTIPAGTAWIALLALAVIAVGVLTGVLLFTRTLLTVSSDRVAERGMLGRVSRVGNAEIGSLVMVELYRDNTLDTQPNLFICDRSGAVRIRLRGQYWTRESMEAVAEVLERPIDYAHDVVTLAELRTTRPEWLYWFERVRPLSWF
jgi:hypothetical protein